MELGIDVQGTGSELEETQIHNQAGDLLARIPVGEMSRKLGAPSYEVRRGDLLAAIFEKLPPESFKTGYECSSVCEHANFVEIQFTTGEQVQADLVIGADGIHSIVRKHVAGDIPLRYSGYSGASGVTQGSHPDLPPLTHVDVWGRGGKAGIGMSAMDKYGGISPGKEAPKAKSRTKKLFLDSKNGILLSTPSSARQIKNQSFKMLIMTSRL